MAGRGQQEWEYRHRLSQQSPLRARSLPLPGQGKPQWYDTALLRSVVLPMLESRMGWLHQLPPQRIVRYWVSSLLCALDQFLYVFESGFARTYSGSSPSPGAGTNFLIKFLEVVSLHPDKELGSIINLGRAEDKEASSNLVPSFALTPAKEPGTFWYSL